jgi:hypothetical protein
LVPKEPFSDQARLLWHRAKRAGWDEARLNALLLKRFKVTHANALNEKQMREALTIMAGYMRKAEKAALPYLRQRIVAIVTAKGLNLDWLHDAMDGWGYGRSLRDLTYARTMEVYDAVRVCFPPHAKGDKH